MEPVIPTGSLIYTIKKPEYAVGDVVTFTNSNEFITHRIVRVVKIGSEKYFSTKGDFNIYEDLDLVHESLVVGKTAAILPEIGKIIALHKTPVYQAFTIGTVIIYIFVVLKRPSRKVLDFKNN